MHKQTPRRTASDTTFRFSQLRDDGPTTIYILIPPDYPHQILCTTVAASLDELIEHGLLEANKTTPSQKGKL